MFWEASTYGALWEKVIKFDLIPHPPPYDANIAALNSESLNVRHDRRLEQLDPGRSFGTGSTVSYEEMSDRWRIMIWPGGSHVSALLIPQPAPVNDHVIIIKHVDTSHTHGIKLSCQYRGFLFLLTHFTLRCQNTYSLHLPHQRNWRGFHSGRKSPMCTNICTTVGRRLAGYLSKKHHMLTFFLSCFASKHWHFQSEKKKIV